MISVIMPVYNAEKYLSESIESILSQSFKEFEFLIFDDASTDNSKQIIKNYSTKDNRIKFFDRKINVGYSNLINESLEKVNFNFIARMDADDISHKERLQKQFDFLSRHLDYSVVGSFIKIIDDKNMFVRYSKYPVENNDIKKTLYEYSTFAHPSTMINYNFLKKIGYYRPIFEPAEDYDLWTRLSTISKLKNIPEYLLSYRQHSKSVSMERKEEQLIKTFFIKKNLKYLVNGKDLVLKHNLNKIDAVVCKNLFDDFKKIKNDFIIGSIHLNLIEKQYQKFFFKLIKLFLDNPFYLIKRVLMFFKKKFSFDQNKKRINIE